MSHKERIDEAAKNIVLAISSSYKESAKKGYLQSEDEANEAVINACIAVMSASVSNIGTPLDERRKRAEEFLEMVKEALKFAVEEE